MVSKMIKLSQSERISCHHILSHPFFWNQQKRLGFIKDLSDIIEAKKSINNVLYIKLKKASSIVLEGFLKKKKTKNFT